MGKLLLHQPKRHDLTGLKLIAIFYSTTLSFSFGHIYAHNRSNSPMTKHNPEIHSFIQ
jgi:hypothetical protein